MNSSNKKEILEAFQQGKKIWKLDTGTHGGDDILIGKYEECRKDVIMNEEEDVFETQGWTLKEIGSVDEPLRSIIDEIMEENE